MDKKRLIKGLPAEDLKGFEEFIEGSPNDTNFLPRPTVTSTKKETSFEHFTFLTTEGERLTKIKKLILEKLPFAEKFKQAEALTKQQNEEIALLRKKIFQSSNKENSPYQKSLKEIFDSYFSPLS